MATSGHRPKTKPDDLGSLPVQAARVYIYHRHLFLLVSPKADTHFTVPRRVEGPKTSRLGLPSWLVTYRDGLPVYRQ